MPSMTSAEITAQMAAIPAAEIKTPSIPVDAFIQESQNLYAWCQEDLPALTTSGLSSDIVESLKPLSEMLRDTESNWHTVRFKKEDVRRTWESESKTAGELRSKLLHICHFAYRNFDDINIRVGLIQESGTYADMIQDLNDLYSIGTTYPDQLTAIGIDMTLFTQAKESAVRLGELLALANAGDTDNGAKEDRDRIYTLLKKAVDEVRTVGQYVFWRDKERLPGYVSAYVKRHSGRKPKTTEPVAA